MFLTDPEKDFWPWHWQHDGKVCETIEDYRNAWLSIDWQNDGLFSPYASKTRNRTGDPITRNVSKGIQCVTAKVDVSDKISLADYQDYAIRKFDQQMRKIADSGSISLGVSAGIDSTMCLSWLVKNKVEFNTFTWIEDPWKGQLNSMVSEKAVEMARRLGVEHTLIDYRSTKFNKHDLIRDYCEADGYDFPQMQLMSEGDAWNEVWQELIGDRQRMAPIGSDDLFLHEQTSWNRFIPSQLMEYVSVKNTDNLAHKIFNNGYKIGGNEREFKKYHSMEEGYQMISGWHDVLLYHMFKGKMVSPATSKEWWEMWHRIDESSCTNRQLQDIVNVGWLRRQVSKWLGSDKIDDLITSVPCTEIFYSPNEANAKYLREQCKKIARRYYSCGKPALASWWWGIIRVLNCFNKISPRAVESIHTINWFLKNQ
jgi:hypothetical protein